MIEKQIRRSAYVTTTHHLKPYYDVPGVGIYTEYLVQLVRELEADSRTKRIIVVRSLQLAKAFEHYLSAYDAKCLTYKEDFRQQLMAFEKRVFQCRVLILTYQHGSTGFRVDANNMDLVQLSDSDAQMIQVVGRCRPTNCERIIVGLYFTSEVERVDADRMSRYLSGAFIPALPRSYAPPGERGDLGNLLSEKAYKKAVDEIWAYGDAQYREHLDEILKTNGVLRSNPKDKPCCNS